MRKLCRYHCAACSRHFANLKSFDAHRQGPWAGRYCDIDEAFAEPEIGDCEIRESESGVRIFRLSESETQTGLFLASLAVSGSTGS